nr:MAG TPA: prohead serine protease [Caudoviricetes sp.]
MKSVDLGEGIISGYASVFGNVDSYGDIVVKGAFSKSIEKIETTGKVISVFYGHNMEDPRANIGRVIELREDNHGLFFRAQLDLSGDTYGRLVYEQLKDGRLDSLSFGFSVIGGANTEDGYELRELELYEISVVPIPANQEAQITEVKAGRAISAKNMELIRGAYEALGELLGAYEDDPEVTDGSGQKGFPLAEIVALLGIEEEK